AINSVTINFTNSQGELDLQVIGPNGYNSTASSYYSGADTLSLTFGQAGTYYVRVYSYYGTTYNPDYSLTITPPPPDDLFENNDTQATAYNLGTLTTTKTINHLR